MAEGKRQLKLLSPVGGPPLIYQWPLKQLSRGKCAVDEATEILDTIRWVVLENPALREGPLNNSTNNIIISDYDCMNELCELYNSEVITIKNQTNSTARRPACKTLLKLILHRTYSHAVFDPEKLNSYQPFSAEVYGETSYEMIDQLMDDVPIKHGDTFLDLGSGVGQVVFQVAATNKCRVCYGIELAHTPAVYAKSMEKHFVRWMKYFGKPYSEFVILEGDFLNDKFRHYIQSSTIIFVNNFAFGPILNNRLKERFKQLPEGVKVISSSEFRPINFRITTRNITDIGTILRVREIHPRAPGSVSWTNNDVCYFIHTVDRSYLEQYIRQQKAKYGDKLDQLFMNADRKIRERGEDDLPALCVENEKRTHIIAHLTEIEIPKVSSSSNLHDLLSKQMEEYISQCSSTYGEAALAVELEQANLLKECLEKQIAAVDIEVEEAEQQAMCTLEQRLCDLGIKTRDIQGIGKELLYHTFTYKHLHKRYDRINNDINSCQNDIKSVLMQELNTWKRNDQLLTEARAEVGMKQTEYKDMISKLPGYDMSILKPACLKEILLYKDRTASLSQLLGSIKSMEKENAKLEEDVKTKNKILAQKKAKEEYEASIISDQSSSKPKQPAQNHEKSVKIPSEFTKRTPNPKPSIVVEKRLENHILDRSKAETIEGMSHLDAILARNGLGCYISNDFNDKGKNGQPNDDHRTDEPKMNDRIDERRVGRTPKLSSPSLSPAPENRMGGEAKLRVEQIPDNKFEGNNSVKTSRPPSTSSTVSHRSILQQQQKQINNMTASNTATSNMSSINSLLIQQQTMAQREQDKSYEQAMRNVGPNSVQAVRNTASEQPLRTDSRQRGELKTTEEKVLSSGTVPAKLQLQAAPSPVFKDKQPMLKTTSPRLQLTTQSQNKQTVMVPHYMLGKEYVHKNQSDPYSALQSNKQDTMMSIPGGSSSRGASKPSTPMLGVPNSHSISIPASNGTQNFVVVGSGGTSGVGSTSAIGHTVTTPSGPAGSLPATHIGTSSVSSHSNLTTPSSGSNSAVHSGMNPALFAHLNSSNSSYFSVYGDPLSQKGGSYIPNGKEQDLNLKSNIQKPKHKYPFQFLHQVFITGYAIMVHNLRTQHPNLRHEVYNDLLLKSNFNPYTYFEYISKLEDFEKNLEQFYRMRPDIGEKCKTREQKLAEKIQNSSNVPTVPHVPISSIPSSVPNSRSATPSTPLARIQKEPNCIPRAPPTIIESYVLPQKHPPNSSAPILAPPQTAELRLTKPTRDPIKSPPNFTFKSPSYPHPLINESPSKSPAKRSESGLQYHHLSVDSFRHDANSKVKVRRRKGSSDIRPGRNPSDSDKVSPTKEVSLSKTAPVTPTSSTTPSAKKTDDPEVTEAAMVILQFQQAIQKKMESGEMDPKTGAPLGLAPIKIDADIPKDQEKTSRVSSPRTERPQSSQPKSDKPKPYDHRQSLKPDKPRTPEGYNGPVSRLEKGHIPHSKSDNPYRPKPDHIYRPRDIYRPDNHSSTEYRPRDHQPQPADKNRMDGNVMRSREHPDHTNPAHSRDMSRENNSRPRDREMSGHNRDREGYDKSYRDATKHRGGDTSASHIRDVSAHQREALHKENNRESSSHKDREIRHSTLNHHDRSNNDSNSSRLNPAHISKPSQKISPTTHGPISKPYSSYNQKPETKHRPEHSATPKMPDLNKQPTYSSGIDHFKHMDIQNELKSVPTTTPKPPLHNPRTHMMTTAPIPPPELKKARNFNDIHLRELPSQPPEMRIAPTHVDSRPNYIPQPVNNRPDDKPTKHMGDKIYNWNSNEEKAESKTKIEVKTVSHLKKLSAKDNPKLMVVTKSLDKRREDHKSLTANLAFEFKGSPEYNKPKQHVTNNKPHNKTPDGEMLSSPELVIEEEGKCSPMSTVKAIPDSSNSRLSPDSSSTLVKPADSSQGEQKHLTNGNSAAMLGYVLEDVSPPSTSPDHPKREITQEGLLETYLNNKRRKLDAPRTKPYKSSSLPESPKRPLDQVVDSDKTNKEEKHPKFSFSNSHERTTQHEDTNYYPYNNNTKHSKPNGIEENTIYHPKSDPVDKLFRSKEDKLYRDKHSDTASYHPELGKQPGKSKEHYRDERPIQSQDLSSSSNDISNDNANKHSNVDVESSQK